MRTPVRRTAIVATLFFLALLPRAGADVPMVEISVTGPDGTPVATHSRGLSWVRVDAVSGMSVSVSASRATASTRPGPCRSGTTARICFTVARGTCAQGPTHMVFLWAVRRATCRVIAARRARPTSSSMARSWSCATRSSPWARRFSALARRTMLLVAAGWGAVPP